MHAAKEQMSSAEEAELRPAAEAPSASPWPQEPAQGARGQAARQRNRATQQLLRAWLSDESGYDEETWPELKKALEENRSAASAESLFCD